MIAKLIVTGRTRQQALERSRRALDELVIEGMPTVTPFHRAVVSDPAFAPADPDEKFTIHTRWIETEFDNTIPPYAGGSADAAEAERAPDGRRRGRRQAARGLAARWPLARWRLRWRWRQEEGAPALRRREGGLRGIRRLPHRPMQGTIVKIAVEEGATVAEGDLVVVLEAMKMEQPITAHKAGTVTGLAAEVGATVSNGAVLCEIKDE